MTLRQWMDKLDLSILDASKAFGVSTFAIKKWLKGERTPRPKMQAKIKKITRGQIDGNAWMKDE